MNIVQRKLIYNESDIHMIIWRGSPCFIVSEVAKAFDGVNREDLALFLRHNASVEKGTDYDVIQDEDARRLRSYLDESGVVKRFAKAMIVYFSGLRKYFDYRRIRQVMDFNSYLIKNKVNIYESKPQNIISPEIAGDLPDSGAEGYEAVPAVHTVPQNDIGYNGYSEFLKHIAFMEEFINTVNKLNISPDKSVSFMVDMTKFLEDQGVQPHMLLIQLKKWVV